MDEIDLDFTELELGSDIDNLKLLRKQLNSVQSIRYEQQRKDELICRLKDRIRHLESESRSYEDIKEHVLMQSRHVMKVRDQEMQEKFAGLHRQMEGLHEKVRHAEDEQDKNQCRLNEANAIIVKFQSKLTKQKDLLEAEKKTSRELQTTLESVRRAAVEKEAALSMEIHSSDKQIQQLKSALHEKHASLEDLRNEHDLRVSQLSAKFFEELKSAKDEAARWKHMHEDLDKSSRAWKQFTESALHHEKLTSSQFQETYSRLKVENEQCSRMYASDVAERNSVIEELRQIVDSTTDELNHLRESHTKELDHIIKERDNQMAQESGDLQKEIGALQVGLCLQKEMKDAVQQNVNHLKSCMRSLALDLTRSFDEDNESETRKYYTQLLDLFDRLLVSGALVNRGEDDSPGFKGSQNWEQHVSHMHSYINQHSVLVSNSNTASPGTVSRYGKSLNIDSDFLSVIKSLRDLLQHVLHEQSTPSSEARKEITRLVEHIQLLKSDLDQSDMLMFSLVNQLMDEGLVNASGLRDAYHPPESVLHSFNPDSGNLEGDAIKFHSGSKQRAVLHAKLCTGVSEAIRAAKLAKTELEREQEETESLRHNLDILKVKLAIDSRSHKKDYGSPSNISPMSKSQDIDRFHHTLF